LYAGRDARSAIAAKALQYIDQRGTGDSSKPQLGGVIVGTRK
jgi:hypothetical protein